MKLPSNVFVISVLMLGLITSPLSFAQTSENDTQDIAIELEESVSINENTGPEDTEIDNDTTNIGQQVSDFVHESRELFQQQKEETKEVIAQCREDMKNTKPSERKSVIKQCRINLDEIRESYKSLREIYHETFKEFRENINVFIQESKGLPIDSAQRDAAITNIKSLSDSPEKRELQQKMDEQIREDKQKLREQEKKEREITREKQKTEKETLKDEHEMLKEQEKKQREMERDLAQKEHEAERDAQDETVDDESSEEIESELEIEVEVKGGIAKIEVESNDEKFEFEMDWIDKQSTIAEISSRTGLTASQIEKVIEFEIELEDESDEDNENEEESEQEDLEDN